MESQLVEVKLIDTIKKGTGIRSHNTFNKEFAVNLAASIKSEGMFNPVLLRPNPEAPGRYIMVQGHHRLYAKKVVLKEELIEAKIATDMDDSDAEMAAISENLWRNALSKAEHFAALRKWCEHYQAKTGVVAKPGAAGSKAAAEKRAKAKAAEALAEAGEEAKEQAAEAEPVVESEPRVTPVDEIIAASTGQSVGAVRKDIRIAKAFDQDQLEALDQMRVGKNDMTRIAKIKDVQKRGEVVNLVASGMEVEDALKSALGDDAPTPVNGKSKEIRQAETVAKAEVVEELTDDQWFEEFCGQKAALIGNVDKYKADAILFRHLSEPRQVFRTKAKKSLAESKKSGHAGPLYNLINRSCSISHPKDWLLCGECDGTGVEKGKDCKCGKCYGSGYHLRTESYI